jgi:glycerol-3-phosphate acyltransferase PlsY
MKLIRKIFHIFIGTIIIISLLYFYDKFNLLIVIGLGIIATFGLIIDFLRMFSEPFNDFLTNKLLPFVFYSEEKKGINSATFFFFSASFSILFFNKAYAIISIAILTFADSLASIIGYKFGRIKIGSKTLEGGLVFFFISVSICLLYIPFWKAIIIASLITLIELTSVKVDDNLSIPIITGFLLNIFGRI